MCSCARAPIRRCSSNRSFWRCTLATGRPSPRACGTTILSLRPRTPSTRSRLQENLGLGSPDDLAGGREELVVKVVEQPIRSWVGLERAPVIDKQPARFASQHLQCVV